MNRTNVAILVAVVTAVSVWYITGHSLSSKMQPSLFVTDGGDQLEEFRAACPHTALMTDEKQAQYVLAMAWVSNRWRAVLYRKDSALLYRAENPDYMQILRDACKNLRKDIQEWPDGRDQQTQSESTKSEESIPLRDMNRYELRDLRNGNVISSALLDRQTGRVWVWVSYGNKGRAFEAEKIFSSTGGAFSKPEESEP